VPIDLGSIWKRKRSNMIAFRNAFGDGYILEVVEQHLGVPSSLLIPLSAGGTQRWLNKDRDKKKGHQLCLLKWTAKMQVLKSAEMR